MDDQQINNTIQLKVLFFAQLREIVSEAEVTLNYPGSIASIEELVTYLSNQDERYREAFALADGWKVAINQQLVEAVSAQLTDHDEVAFFPMFSGG